MVFSTGQIYHHNPAPVPFSSLVPLTLTGSVGSGLSIGGSGRSTIMLAKLVIMVAKRQIGTIKNHSSPSKDQSRGRM
jgi:hypothetical protein